MKIYHTDHVHNARVELMSTELGISGCYVIVNVWQFLNGTTFDASTLFSVICSGVEARRSKQYTTALFWVLL